MMKQQDKRAELLRKHEDSSELTPRTVFEGGGNGPNINVSEDSAHSRSINQSNTGEKQEDNSVPISKFYSELIQCEKFLLTFGFICALAAGLLMPSIAIIMGEVVGTFDPTVQTDIEDLMKTLMRGILIVSFTLWVVGYVYYAFFQQVAETIAINLRGKYLRALMVQEIGYFEQNNVEAMPSDIGQYFNTISLGIGESYAQLLQALGTFIGGFAISFYQAPIFALVCFAYMPIIIIFIVLLGKNSKLAQFKKLEANQALGGYSEEILSALKLVVSFSQEQLIMDKYEKKAKATRDIARRANTFNSSFFGVIRFLMFGFFVFTFFIATVFVAKGVKNPSTHEPYTIVEIVASQQALIMALMQIVSVIPNISNVSKALVVGRKVYDVVERKPEIADSLIVRDQMSQKIHIEDSINFRRVHFRYPTTPAVQPDQLQGVDFKIKAGTSTAIVGPSGSGKSTIVQMIERFYDPKIGEIFFDKTNLKDISLKNLRDSIGYVSQEPVLILGTIKENLLNAKHDASDADIEEALRKANASFVKTLENGLDTYIGSSSVANLSGGQKQRIAIARALIKAPRILILDEATSALDPKSEAEVQEAIDNIAKEYQESGEKLTIIMIAHRLQTIETAQNLLFINNPKEILAAEKGTEEYDSIMNRLKTETYKHQEGADLTAEEKTVLGADYSMEEARAREAVTGHEDEIREDKPMIKKSPSPPSSAAKGNQVEVMAPDADEDIVLEPLFETSNKGFFRVMQHYSPKFFAFLSILVSIGGSMAFPLFGWIFSELLFLIMEGNDDPDFYEDRKKWCLAFLYLAIIMGFFAFAQKMLFFVTGENLTYDVRMKLFSSLIHKQIAWFDRKERAPGILSNILSEDISSLNGLTTETVATIFESFLAIVVGIGVSAFLEWRMAIVCFLATPFVLLGGILMARLDWNKRPGGKGTKQKVIDPYEASNALLSDLILNYRTVISFGQDNIDSIMEHYESMLTGPAKRRVRNAHLAGIAFGYSLCIRFIYIGVIFYIGAVLITKYDLDQKDVFQSIVILFTSALGAGFAVSNMPSAKQASQAAGKIFSIMDEPSKVDVREQAGKIQKVEQGQIEFKDVNFNYPTRRQRVLRDFGIDIKAGTKIGLVGHSGCGKSTITNLLLRFYDLEQGTIFIDGKSLKEYDIAALRHQIGYVMQEPVLFNVPIKENILFGKLHCSDAKVRQVAEMANALQFIESNFEELKEHEQLEVVRRDIVNRARVLGVEQLNELAKLSDLKALLVAKYALDNSDENFKALLKKDTDLFIQIVSEELCNKPMRGMKWDDLILRAEWKQSIRNGLDENPDLASVSTEVMTLTTILPNQFDMESIRAAMEASQSNGTSLHKEIEASKSEFKARTASARSDRLQELYDAQLKQDIALHPGFDKICGLKGSKLSGGQKQRIAIARALIKDPKILILDEATSALDENSQEIVQQALDRAMEGRTSIVIAHRLSTIRNCDVLYVINNGQVVEQGSFDDLSSDPTSYFSKLKAGMEM